VKTVAGVIYCFGMVVLRLHRINIMRTKLVEAVSNIRPDLEIDQNQDFQLHGVLDSLDIVFLVDEIEEKLNISMDVAAISPEIFASLNTLEQYLKGSS
jgi:acyl carrier protein